MNIRCPIEIKGSSKNNDMDMIHKNSHINTYIVSFIYNTSNRCSNNENNKGYNSKKYQNQFSYCPSITRTFDTLII